MPVCRSDDENIEANAFQESDPNTGRTQDIELGRHDLPVGESDDENSVNPLENSKLDTGSAECTEHERQECPVRGSGGEDSDETDAFQKSNLKTGSTPDTEHKRQNSPV